MAISHISLARVNFILHFFKYKLIKMVWNNSISAVTYIAYMSLWRFSPFGHQSKFTCVTADFEHNAFDHAASQTQQALQG